jgi:ATP/maltotriose-dependent transcriptional regulator MalT/DNA-binding SARP family transcriptional activator
MKNYTPSFSKTPEKFPFAAKLLEPDRGDIVKINSPSADGIFPRKRLYALLDKYRSTHVTWITAPAGSGKTSLVTSYLAHCNSPFIWYQCDLGEKDIASFFYYLGLAVKKVKKAGEASLPLLTIEYLKNIKKYSRNYFEQLYLLLEPDSFIIFDNFQEVASDSLLMELLTTAAEYVSKGIRLVFISRSFPPQSMARMQIHKQLLLIDGEDLYLTLEEVQEFVSHYVEGEIAPEVVDFIYTGSRGWIAAVILIINQKERKDLLKKEVNFTSNEIIFDYFASEIFETESPDVKRFLISTAFFTAFTVNMAEEISGNDRTKDILRRLLRHNFFITRHSGSTFQYHPLFREFLISRAERLLGTGRVEICIRKSADLLAQNDKQEEAVSLFIKINEYRSLIGLICREAVHCIQRGQIQTLQSWIEQVPGALQEKYPWVTYWRGVCLLPFDLIEAKSHFKQAYTEFQKKHDVPGIFAAWCGVVESILHGLQDLYELDHWIVTLDGLLEEYKDDIPTHLENQVAAAMFMSLVFRKPDHPRFSYWKEKALAAFSNDTNITRRIFTGVYLLLHSSWKGDTGMADKIYQEIKAMADSPGAQPLARITGYFVLSYNGWRTGDYKAGLTAVKSGLSLSAETGIVIWNYMMTMQGAANCLSEGNAEGADLWLDKLAENLPQAREYDIFYYHHTRAWQAMIRGKPQKAYAHQQSAMVNIERSGAKPPLAAAHFGMSQVCHETGKFEQRDRHLEECRLYGELYQSHLFLFMAGLAQAQYAMNDGDHNSAAEFLQKAMAAGEREGYYNFSFWRAPVLIPLLIFCLKRGIEVTYVQKIIKKRKLRPPQPPQHLENWPWPIRIYTFGRFSVLRNGTPLVFGRKAPIKVLELLKALISFGGRKVNEDRLSGWLWPDSDGDGAKQALASTLFRLRKWLGEKNVIIRSQGRISLDPYSCWVDVWAVERLLGALDRGESIGRNFTGKATTLYAGDFLAEDTDKSWSTLMRERFRGKMIRAICTEAESLRERDLYGESITCYQKGIEIDPLAEELYQGLMKNYGALGETASALRTYKQLTTVLSSTFDVTPSPSSKNLINTIIGKKN